MKRIALLAGVLGMAGCARPQPAKTVDVGGLPAITLSRDRAGDTLQFTGADILPGRGMNVYRIRAFLPGKGEVDVLAAPPLEEAATIMNGGAEDLIGNKSFSVGGAILLPYANRITGTLSADGKTIAAKIADRDVALPANWGGKNAGARKYAMHGLMLDAKMTDVKHDRATVSGVLHAGNFGGRWLGSTDVAVDVELQSGAFLLTVKATNVGQDNVPVGIGWHPYFALPSADRKQALLHVPAVSRGIVNNYDEVLPTGQKVAVKATPYDFHAAGGKSLGDLFMDDTFLDLEKNPDNSIVSTIADPSAKYGIRITAYAPEIHAIQVYAPVDKAFVVLEPQYNYAEPFSSIWKGAETGMQTLAPGQSTTYRVKLELFVP